MGDDDKTKKKPPQPLKPEPIGEEPGTIEIYNIAKPPKKNRKL